MILVIFSFNATRSTLHWGGFTLDWYRAIFSNQLMLACLSHSVQLGLLAAAFATVVGVSAAVGLRKLSKHVSQRYEAYFVLPLLVPEIVTAVGLLVSFSRVLDPALANLDFSVRSLVLLVSGHLSFAVSYVIVLVKARLKHLDSNLELAARNLGANRLQVFSYILLPQLWPAILCAFLLVFTLSLDDFYLSHFLSYGGSGFTTLPVYLFGLQSRSGLTPEVNAIASLMMLVSITLIGLTSILYWFWIRDGKGLHAQ